MIKTQRFVSNRAQQNVYKKYYIIYNCFLRHKKKESNHSQCTYLTGVSMDFELTNPGHTEQFVLIINITSFIRVCGDVVIVVPFLPVQAVHQGAFSKLRERGNKSHWSIHLTTLLTNIKAK